MIPTWFNSDARLSALRACAKQCEGTPFFANSEAPGKDGGFDCIRGLHYILRTVGVIPRLELPLHTMDHGQHSEHSLLIEAFETWPVLQARFACVWRQTAFDLPPASRPAAPASDILGGDILCFLAGKVPHHGGMALNKTDFIHTLKPAGMHVTQLGVVFRGWKILGGLAAVYRPLP